MMACCLHLVWPPTEGEPLECSAGAHISLAQFKAKCSTQRSAFCIFLSGDELKVLDKARLRARVDP